MRNLFYLAATGTLALGTILTAPVQQACAQSSSAAAPAPAPPPAEAAPTPLPTPSVTGPLQWLPPANFSAGPFGKFAANGIVTGSGLWQGNHVPGDNTGQAALSNGQIFIQKPDGPVQLYVQVGAYTMPSLGTPFLAADKTVSDFFGPVPVAFLKIPAGKNTSFQIGELPTVMGAEYTFTFENMNVERGLLWNQENAINRGVQVNQALGKYFSASLSWNDGYYSNRYSWLSGLLTFTKGHHSIAFSGMGNLGQTAYQTIATPVQNNSTMYALIYTYTNGNWIVQPYWQYSNVPTNPAVGVLKGASANGGAILASRTFKHGFSLPARFEYITTSGSASSETPYVNLLYGPGSSAVSGTITPTYQAGGLYIRGDLSWVHAGSYTPGDVFGPNGTNSDQPRAMIEVGFIFGNNLTER